MHNSENRIINDVTSKVSEKMPVIQSAKGKDLTIFIGETTTGKSTTINHLLGVKFIEDEENGNVIPINRGNVIAPIGDFERGNAGCTYLPDIFHLPGSPMAYLDAQGSSDTRSNHDMNISSSILMEVAIKKAKSIRIVILTKYETFKSGIGSFHKIGELLSRLVKTDDVPVYFCFNRFQPSMFMIKKNFYAWSESEKNREIKKQLFSSYERIKTGLEDMIDDAKTRIVTYFLRENGRHNIVLSMQERDSIYNTKASLNQKPEYIENNQKILYLSILKNSFSNNYYGYIDPTSNESRDSLIYDILRLPTINISNIALNGFNKERVEFDMMFDRKMMNENKFLKQVLFSIKYPESVFNNLIEPLRVSLSQNRNKLDQINQNGVSDEILNEFNEETKQRRQSLIASIANLKQQKESTLMIKYNFENSNPVPFWNDHWENKPGLLWWRNYLCKYPLSIPYVRVDEDLDENTSRRKVISETSPNYEILYSSGGKVRKGVGIAVSVLTGPIGAGVMGICSHKCKGKVTLFTYPKILQPAVIPKLDQQISLIDLNLEISENKLNILNNNCRNNIVEQFNNLIQILERDLLALETLKSHVHETLLIWNRDHPAEGQLRTKKNDIFCYYNSIKLLYSDISNRFAISEFQNTYQSVIHAQPLNNENINAEDVILEGNLTFN